MRKWNPVTFCAPLSATQSKGEGGIEQQCAWTRSLYWAGNFQYSKQIMWRAEFPKAGRETSAGLRVSVPAGTKSRMFAVLLALLLFDATVYGADETAVAHSDKGLQL